MHIYSLVWFCTEYITFIEAAKKTSDKLYTLDSYGIAAQKDIYSHVTDTLSLKIAADKCFFLNYFLELVSIHRH